MPAKKPSGANKRANGRSTSKLDTRASKMPAPNPAAPQARPIPIAPRMRRPHFFMTTSRHSIGRAFHMVTIECQVLCDTEYASGRWRSRAPSTECDEAGDVRMQARCDRRARDA